MQLDRTFCLGTGCKRTKTCDRHVDRVREIYPGTDIRISVSDFLEPNGDCSLYAPVVTKVETKRGKK